MSGEEEEDPEVSHEGSQVRDGVYVVTFTEDGDTIYSVSSTSFSIPDQGDEITLHSISIGNDDDDEPNGVENFGSYIVKGINKGYTKFDPSEGEGLLMMISIEVEPVEAGE